MTRTKRTWLVIGIVATVGLMFVAVFPARTYLDQQHRRQQAQARINATDAQNRRLQHRIDTLHTDAEVERLAREQYNLVRPGEEAYAILPTRQPPAAVDPAPPKAKAKGTGNWLTHAWHSVTSVF